MMTARVCLIGALVVTAGLGTLAFGRTWKDITGKHKIEADFAGVEGDDVKLQKADGTITKVPLDKLSEVDQRYVAKQLEAEKEGRPPKPTAKDKPTAEMKTMTNSIGMTLVLIPAGFFMMGSPNSEENHQPDEGPVYKAILTKSFYLGVHEVTQGEYQQVMETNPSEFKEVEGQDTSRFPVETVTWREAVEFCSRLSEKEGRKYRLPTEAEWEYACRAGTSTPFSFGATLTSNQANCNGDYPYGTEEKGPFLERPTTVGSYKPNAWGLFDMHGNVWEWTSDYPDHHAGHWNYGNRVPYEVDPVGPKQGIRRLVRGGCWKTSAGGCRSAARLMAAPHRGDNVIGFRIACSS